MLSQVVELIENKHNFAITTHVDRTATESVLRSDYAGSCVHWAKPPKLSSATDSGFLPRIARRRRNSHRSGSR
jgi:hypothetical protein